MGLFNKMKEPIFLKESSNAEEQLVNLKTLEPLLNKEGQGIIRQDIQYLEYGSIGEKNIAFELNNSHLPMYILHDIYIETEGLSAQIDYLVFTRKLCFVIECKNLFGNIEINSSGDFIRTMEFGRFKRKEGVYSPITQNQRHLELLKKVKVESKSNIISKIIGERYFNDFYKPIIVLANPKTVLNAKYAKKEVKNQVIRADQLIKYIREMINKSKEVSCSDKELLSWAQSFLSLHKEVQQDYTGKYEKYKEYESKISQGILTDDIQEEGITVSKNTVIDIEETVIYKELREYRLIKSREEMIKPYFIYNNNQLMDLISKKPLNKKELLKVTGFGAAKVEKYGDDIVKIVGKYGK